MRTKKAIEEWLRSDAAWKDHRRVGAITVDWLYIGDRLVMRVRTIRQKREFVHELRDIVFRDEAEVGRPSYYFVNNRDWITEDTGLKALVDLVYEEERR